MMDRSRTSPLSERAQELFESHQQRIYRRIDRMFTLLLLLQWFAAVEWALWATPQTWVGAESKTHPHVWMAVFLGAALCSLPTVLAWLRPGSAVTRYTIAVAQVMFSSLLIHISGGRIETHFHVFGSLAFLAAYRDWKVLIPSTLVVAADHFLRGMYWPESVFGVLSVSPWRWLEHAGWVIFEDIFLIFTIRLSVDEMKETARQTAELESNQASLQESSDQLNLALEKERAIIEGALDAVILMDLNGDVIGWNGQADKIFGWTASEAIGKQLSQLIVPEAYREAHDRGLQKFRECGHGTVLNQRIEMEGLRKDGTQFPLELAITPVYRDEETTFCAFVRDITDRRNNETELREAKEQAELANCSKSEFLANMSHEIRTPLGGILGYTDVLRRGVGSEEQRANYLDTIRASGDHLLTLINDILDLSKIEAGRMEFEHVRCSPHEIFSDVLSVLRVRAHEKCLRLDYESTTSVPEAITTDPARLRQLLINLVSNAIKFTETGGVTIRAAVDAEAAEPKLIVEIEDTGIGIPQEHRERIFQPFDQADNSITRRFGGTGLGLTICKHIVEGLGGDIAVESEVGRGSLFCVKLKTGSLEGVAFLDRSVSEALQPAAKVQPKSLDADCLRDIRVLLVEDGETNRDLISTVLTESGATIICAENGEKGVAAATAGTFDVILMDMQMPVMDGYTAATKLREQGCTLPIIALTAHAMRGDREKCVAAGCTDYLTKPIVIDKLLHTVGSVAAPSPEIDRTQPTSVEIPATTIDDDQSPITSTLPIKQLKLETVVEQFATAVADKLDEMHSALESREWSNLAELAHWLKGTGGTIGFGCFTQPAAELEQAAKQSDAEQAEQKLRKLISLANRIAVPLAADR